MGNLVNLRDARKKGVEAFAANFPSLSGEGYCTASTNGLCVFDNGDEKKIRVAKDFVRFLYTDETVMQYTLGTLPVNRSIIEQYQDEIWMLEAYGKNTACTVDNIRSNLNWQGVRDVFHPQIGRLLAGVQSPAQTAAEIDQRCNAALEKGRNAAG